MSSSGESNTDLQELGASAMSSVETDARTPEEKMQDRLETALGILDYLNSKHFYGADPIRTEDGLLIDLHRRELRYSTDDVSWNRWHDTIDASASSHVVPMDRICTDRLDDVENRPYSRFLDQIEAFALQERARWDAAQPEGAIVRDETVREARNRLEDWLVTPDNFPDYGGAVRWVQEKSPGSVSLNAKDIAKLPDFPLVHKPSEFVGHDTYIAHSIVALDAHGDYLTEEGVPIVVGHVEFEKVRQGWRLYITQTEEPRKLYARIDPRIITLKCVPTIDLEDPKKFDPKLGVPANVLPISNARVGIPHNDVPITSLVLEEAADVEVPEGSVVTYEADKERKNLERLLREARAKAQERRQVLAAELSEQRQHAPDLVSGESAEEVTAYGTRVVADFEALAHDGALYADVVEWPNDRVVRLLLAAGDTGVQYVEVGAPVPDADFEDPELGLHGKTYLVKLIDNTVTDPQLLAQEAKIAKLTTRLSP